jgi:hypothetical protein
MRSLAALVVVASAGGCEEQEPTPPQTPQATEAIAVVSQGEHTTLVFAETQHLDAARDVVMAKRPTGFPWVAIGLPASHAAQAASAKGVVLDLADPATGATFSQSYQAACNPAREDFSPCWLYESYAAGDDHLTGSIELKVAAGTATALYEVTWEGLTDRFGDPIQWHKHGTSGRAIGATQVMQ